MGVRTHVDDHEAQQELARLGSLNRVAYHLESLLSRQFQASEAAVHVLTGSLKGSADLQSGFDEDTWTGRLSWGGAAPGEVNDPVVYAVYEKARGGLHDFREPAVKLGSGYHDIVAEHLNGHR